MAELKSRTVFPILVVLTILAFAALSPLAAQAQIGPDYWRVTGVASDDYLNIRTGPSTSNRVIGKAPNGFIFRNLGCRGSGDSRWCNVETPSGELTGWVAGRFLQESGAPGSQSASASNVPELHVRSSGEYEVRFSNGCTALFNPSGRRINAGSSCSSSQLGRASDAVERYMREQGITGGANPSLADVNIRGTGIIIGGGSVSGHIFGHSEGHYAVSITAIGSDPLTCTGLFDHPPSAVSSESTILHCTNGASGSAIYKRKSNSDGGTMTFALTNGTSGYVIF